MSARARRGRGTARGGFSLVEVLVALTILGLFLGAVFMVMGQAAADTVRARAARDDEHALAQATEYLLLDPEAGSVPARFLPDGYRASARIEAAGDADPAGGWRLETVVVQVVGADGAALPERRVSRLVPEEP